MRLFFIFAAVIFFSGKTLAQWQLQHPDGFNNSIYKMITPPGSAKTYAFGSGLFLVSDDAGRSWQTQGAGLPIEFRNLTSVIHTTARFKDVFFTSENTGYLLNKNIIFKTTDKGESWLEVLNNHPNRDKFLTSAYFESLFFVNENVGYAVGWFDKIFKTIDAGASWDTLRWSTSSTPFRRLTAVHFLDAETGFAAGYEIDDYFLNIGVYQHFLLKTTDGGKTWSETLLGGESDHQLANIQFLNNQVGYLLLSNQNRFFPPDKILKTTDGGTIWNQLTIPGMIIRDMAWANEKVGFAIGGPGFVLAENLVARTTDGGANWKVDTLNTWEGFNMNHCFDIELIDEQHAIITGAGGNIYHTADQGETWETGSFTYPDIQAIDMISDNLGYAAGANGLLMKTTDGTQWDTLPNTGYFNAINLYFESESEGQLLSSTGLHATNDGGLQWQEVFTSGDTIVLSFKKQAPAWWAIARVNSLKKIVLMKSTDRGKSWEVTPIDDISNTISRVYDFTILNGDTLLLSTPTEVLKTENGGASWQPIPNLSPDENDYFINIQAVDSQSGFLYSLLGKVWKINDGGAQWEKVYEVPYFYHRFKMFFKNDQEGFLVGNAFRHADFPTEGILLYTEDGGRQWTEQLVPKNEGLTSLAWTPSRESVYVTGRYGTILYLDQEPEFVTGITTGEKNLLSVYPNPATKLVHLSLPSALGNEIEVSLLSTSGHLIMKKKLTLNEQQSASINLEWLGQGVYILNVLTNNQKFVEKIILAAE